MFSFFRKLLRPRPSTSFYQNRSYSSSLSTSSRASDVELELTLFDKTIDSMGDFGKVVDKEIDAATASLRSSKLKLNTPGKQYGAAAVFGGGALAANALASGVIGNFGDRMSPGSRAMVSAGGLAATGVLGLSAGTHLGRGVILGRAKNPLVNKTPEIQGILKKGQWWKGARKAAAIKAAQRTDGSALRGADAAVQQRAVDLLEKFKNVSKGDYKTAAKNLKDNAQLIVGASARKRAADFSFRKMLIGKDYFNRQGNQSFGLAGGIGNMFGAMVGKGTIFGKTDPSMSLIGASMSGGFLGGSAIGGITGYTARKKGKLGSSGPMQRQRGRSFANISHNATLTSHRMAKR